MTKSQTAVRALSEVDPQFAVLVETLFGKAADPEQVWEWVYTPEGVSKMLEVTKAGPDQADLNAGGPGRARRAARRAGRLVRRGVGPLGTSVAGGLIANQATGWQGGKSVRSAVGRGAAGLATGVAGGVIANQIPQNTADSRPALKRAKGTLKPRRIRSAVADLTSKSAEVVWTGEFSKIDSDKHEVFGWASVVKVDGKEVVDKQGDVIDPEDIEKAAYAYVLNNRKGGHQHRRDGEQPFHASNLIESFVVTPEKIEKMNLPEDTPVGWWVGYKVHDEDTWGKIKRGEVTGFSIHGRGKRLPIGV